MSIEYRNTSNDTAVNTADLVLKFLRSQGGRFIRHDHLVRAIGCSGNKLAWALISLRWRGQIEASGHHGTMFERYRLAQIVTESKPVASLRRTRLTPSDDHGDAEIRSQAKVSTDSVVQVDHGSATLLESWLAATCKSRGSDAVASRDVLRCGPGALRDKAALSTAVAELVKLGRVTLAREGRKHVLKIQSPQPTALSAGTDYGFLRGLAQFKVSQEMELSQHV